MHRLLVSIALVGCTKSTSEKPQAVPETGVAAIKRAPDAAPVDFRLHAMPATIPPGPYVIRYDCFHSDQPFGEGHQVRNTSYDLAKGTWTLYDEQGTGKITPQGEELTKKTTSGAIPAPQLAKIEAALTAFLHGGPYREEVPVPEGTPCELAVGAGGTEFFKMSKAYAKEQDLATALLVALNGS